MRANIEHKEYTTGLLRKTTWFQVVTGVEFTEEEKAVIKQRKLDRTVVLEREPDAEAAHRLGRDYLLSLGDTIHLKIGDLLNPRKPDVYNLKTPLEAKQYEENVLASLKKLKQYIVGNVGIEEKSKTVEI